MLGLPLRLHSLGLTIAVVGALCGPTPTDAQEACEFVDPGNDVLVQRPPFAYVTNPHFRCEGDVEIWADSAVVNQDQSMSILIGDVRYVDGVRELTAAQARYFYELGRLQATGNVLVTNHEDGSGVENGDLVYLRQTEYRDVEEMTFTTGDDRVRPRATVYPERPQPSPGDTTAVSADVDTPPAEYVIVGDSLFFRGDSYFTATGSVEITRDSLFAFADSAEYTGEDGSLVLDGSARVEGSAYDLVGRTIVLASAADGSDEVRALRDAVLDGEDLRVTAPQIILDLVDGELEGMVAVSLTEEADSTPAQAPASGDESLAGDSTTLTPVRPVAVSQDIELTGDSLDLAAPGGELQRIFAAGTARSVSTGRPELNVELLPDLARQDWIEGDSIEVLLVPVDSASRADGGADGDEGAYEVERITARGAARSLYRLIPSDSTAVPGVDPPAVSYMVADRITIFMADGQAERVESEGQVSGWHLEPLAPTVDDGSDDAAQPDSATAPASPPSPGTDAPRDPAGDDGGDGGPPAAYLSPPA